MKTKRFVSTLLALLLICGLPVSAFADTWYVDDGNITVNATESGQTVTQGAQVDVPDSAPVITQSDSSTPTTNTVTITATENATANVTIQDVNIVISASSEDTTQYKGQAAVTIDVADGASANVTLDGVRIDTENTGGVFILDTLNPYQTSGYAAVQITGNGDVTLELDGDNTVQSGFKRAGVEKNTTDDSGNGNLTITDENGTDGSLEATGGISGSGIGGGNAGSGSNITISGNAEVTATGGQHAAGIGGGINGSGSNITITENAEVTATSILQGAGIGGGINGSGSNIIISDTAKVTATGGKYSAGIGGGPDGSGSHITISGSAEVTAKGGNAGSGIGGGDGGAGNNITISGSAEVTAKGGNAGSGIGGGLTGTGSNITVSQNAQVKAQGGEVYQVDDWYYSEGAAIGDGGAEQKNAFPDPGAEVDPDIRKLTPNGRIEYYAPGADMETDAPYKILTGTYGLSQPAELAQTAPLYRVIDQDGKALSCKAERQDGVLTITVDADIASLTGKLGGIQTLKAQGIDTIVFVTNGATSTFALSDLLSQGSTGNSYTLTHDGSTVTFTLNNVTDVSAILQ